MTASVRRIAKWIEKHAAVIDPHTQELLQKELQREMEKPKAVRKRKVKA